MFVNTYNKTDVAAPFGGFKMSGFGKDLGKSVLMCCVLELSLSLLLGEEALNEYLRTKVVTVEY